MSDVVIQVKNLSKLYRIGKRQASYGSLRESIMQAASSPLKHIRNSGNEDRDPETIWALKDVSFEVKRGEVLGIIGRNGAGKSTLLKILSRITKPTEGRVHMRGRVGSLLEVGTGFHPELTGRENVYLNGAILGMQRTEIYRKFDEIVAFAEIEKFLDTPVKRYSSGMYVRLAFAVAAHLEPEILLVDEVLAVGDVEFQKKCLGKMDKVAKGGRTVLFVSHNMAAIENLCLESLILENGENIYRGGSSESIRMYLSRTNTIDPQIDLTIFRNQQKKEILQLQTLNIFDVNGKLCSIFPIGATIVLEINYFAHEEINDPHIGIGINNSRGVRVFTVNTRWDNTKLPIAYQKSKIYCVMADLNLVPDQYFLKIAIGEHNFDLDIASDIPAFEIIQSDIWGSGELPNSFQGVVMNKVIWKTT